MHFVKITWTLGFVRQDTCNTTRLAEIMQWYFSHESWTFANGDKGTTTCPRLPLS
jgi:hypothetical protein